MSGLFASMLGKLKRLKSKQDAAEVIPAKRKKKAKKKKRRKN